METRHQGVMAAGGGAPGGSLVRPEISDLVAVLRSSTSAGEACEAVATHIALLGPFMPSIYLERGGRLRCQACHGYWQILDGFPPTSGVIARTYRSGEPVFIPDVEQSPDYLAAVPGVRREAAAPIKVSGRVVGVVNVESQDAMEEDLLPALVAIAGALGERLGQLGGAPLESRWQRLSHYAAKLAGLLEPNEIEAASLEALGTLSKLDSGMLVRLSEEGEVVGLHAEGPLASDLEEVPAASLKTISSWVESASSCYSLGDPGAAGFTGDDSLRTLGVNAVIVLALGARGNRLGFLLAADRSATLPPTDEVELLELLATQTATCLQTADAVSELRRRAALDPLTGLGHHASFGAAMARVASSAPRSGRIAVVVGDVDGFKKVNDTLGHQAGDTLLVEVSAAMAAALRSGDLLYRIGGDEFATVLQVSDEEEARAIGERLRVAALTTGKTVSVGVAMGSPLELEKDLLHRADEALYEVKNSGRNGVRVACA